MTDTTPYRERLADDPQFRDVLFVVIDFEGTTPKGYPAEPIEVAALGIQHVPGRGPMPSGLSYQSFISPPQHAPLAIRDTAQTGITSADLAEAPAARAALRALDTILPTTPTLLVAHHAPTEANILYAYRAACPHLAQTRIVDTRLLAKHILPDLPAYDLDALLAHHGIPQPARRHRAMDDVTVTAELFRRLLTAAARPRAITSLHDLVRVASRTPRATQPTQLELP
ncbi:PolC-type DNA polymerase III [Streptomyces sp. NPDC051218]|uniref:PolC-type DNA polymerase III n=1 Tax=Streptomyces sp. NPDC051218 TaxID=3365645 RepID=UPI0037B6648A